MHYPQLKNKYRQKALFGPETSLDLRRKPKRIPKKYLLIYESLAIHRLQRTHDLKEMKLSNGLYNLYSLDEIGLVKINGIGSPHASCVLEDLVHLGGETFLNLGITGGLTHPGVFLCSKSLRDEGTSYHYSAPGKYSYPDKGLTDEFAATLENLEIKFKIAPNWTIDAPYRETLEEIETYRKKGIATVDMESSALFSVAKFRRVRIASGFVVSDLLFGKREAINKKDYMNSLNEIIEAGIICLNRKVI